MSGESKSASLSGSLALDGSREGLSIKGNGDNSIAAKSDIKAEEDIVGATINLSNLDESDVRTILETLKPYEHNMKVLTKKDLSAGVGLDSFGLGLKNSTEGLLKSDLSLDSSADLPTISFNGLSGGLNAEHGVDGKITGPTINGDLTKLSLNKPSADAGAAVTMPSIGLPGSDIKADIDGWVKTPDVSVSAPQVKMPNASLKVDKPDLKSGEYQAPNIKLPKLKLPKPEMDVSGDMDLPSVSGKVDAPNLNLSTPKSSFSGGLNALHGVDGKITGPTINGDLPKLSLNKPSADADAAVTMPSIGLPGSEIKADIDGSLKTPDVSVSAPQVKIPNASLKVDKPNLKSGEYQAPKFKMPNFKLPKTEPPKTEMDVSGDVDLPSVSGKVDAPNLNLSTPKSHFNKPNFEFNEPKVNLNDPNLKLEAPNADIEAPSGKIKWPHFKLKSAKVKGPDTDLDAEMSVPDANVPTAKVDGDLDVDIDFPKADIKGPEVDVDSPSGKINWPHLKWKKPKFHGSKDNLDIDANIDPPDVDLSLPKVKGGLDPPDVDMNLPKADIKGPDFDVESTSGKINWPHLKWKKPKFHGSKDNLDIDANIDPPDVDLSLPKVKGGLDPPDVDMNLPKADIKGPDFDVESTSGEINWPHLKWKKRKARGLTIDGDLNTPDVNLVSPKIEGDINVPKAELNLPKADLTAPDVDPPSGKVNWPHLKWKKSKVHGPKAEVDADWNAPDVNFSTPKIDGKINSPDVDLNLPKAEVDIEKPEMDIDSPSGKIKWLTFKKPKWAISKPKVNGPDVDLDADLSGPDLDLSAPKIDGKIHTPDVDVNFIEI
ncbi:PREDICTED: neuroblast differentiation-associated protein AHNAK-like [Poecilia mexicana]|uniref:neuroblast differentiation-associated protein AHNAK-like n=1 Tax=Poecilia mexicana TaxID=48701 RepID=UPI00072E8299|nr:PREDICTED: neuroblast differentiation-associated protein AHNAK-like [Poecilia mexicana]